MLVSSKETGSVLAAAAATEYDPTTPLAVASTEPIPTPGEAGDRAIVVCDSEAVAPEAGGVNATRTPPSGTFGSLAVRVTSSGLANGWPTTVNWIAPPLAVST